MKNLPPLTSVYSARKNQGFALVIVLACLLFITALIVTFLVSMRTEVSSSKASADSAQARQLGDMAVNLAIAQIREATLAAGSQKLAWASQPGMIRLYNDEGEPAGYRKLYSWGNMVGTGAFDPFATDEQVDAGWKANGAIYTDLNAPIKSGDEWVFPIFNEKEAEKLGVQGVSVTSPPGVQSNDTQQAPMPVKWLYVLADGSVHLPGGGGDIATVAAASATNPIIGRIAFWTDDETCKININTASDGKFWATPRFFLSDQSKNYSSDEEWLAKSQTTKGEFQRYPGHPATVSLKQVFSSAKSADLVNMAPRLTWGGSEGGTRFVQNSESITVDSDRLYASVEEYMFKAPDSVAGVGAKRSEQGTGLDREGVGASKFFLTAHSRAPELNLFGLPRVASWPIHEDNNNDARTANDRLLAFCSTIGGQPFYFTRKENVLTTYDITRTRNSQLLNYLDNLTSRDVPGFGESFNDKYGQYETRQILTEIFDYIRCTNIFDRSTTAVGGAYPYAFGISSRLTPKGNTNHGEGGSLGMAAPAIHEVWKTRGFGGRFLQISEAHIHFVALGRGELSNPANPSATPKPAIPIEARQYGTRIDMDLTADATGNTPPKDTVAIQGYLYFSTLTPSEGIELWSPAIWVEVEGLGAFKVKQSPTAPDYTALGFPNNEKTLIWGNMLGGNGVAGARIQSLDAKGFVRGQTHGKVLDPAYADKRYVFPFFSNIIPVDALSSTMAFKGGELTVRVYVDKPWGNNGVQGDLVQTFKLSFPDADFPTPTLRTNSANQATGIRWVGVSKTNEEYKNSPQPTNTQTPDNVTPAEIAEMDRFDISGRFGYWFIDAANDVFKTVVLKDGDVRMLLAPNDLNDDYPDYFQPADGYLNSAIRVVHGRPGSSMAASGSGSRGVLVNGATNDANVSAVPFVPAHITGGVFTATGALGDWDNGTSKMSDGPWINAPDAGSVKPEATSGDLAYYDNSNTSASAVPAFFSPNRQMPSPGMFGSLPTGLVSGKSWQTLLFRPGPPNHPGSAGPKDHLLLDLFWMPIVEPYAISEPFSTAGKINMNQQLVPFTYIKRMTGLRAAMAAEEIAMVPLGESKKYKRGTSTLTDSRKPIKLDESTGSLRQIIERFNKDGEIFRSATEICDIFLVPDGESWSSDSSARSAWYSASFALVGDNTRERPYAHLYNKLTTKSNTYTVHYHVQALSIPKSQNQTTFNVATGSRVISDSRGSTTIERYLDPNDPRFINGGPKSDPEAVAFLADPGTSADNNPDFSLEPFYRFHILQSSTFAP